MVEVRRDIQGKAVRRYTARDVHTDGGDLGLVAQRPRAGHARNAARGHAEISAGPDQHLFQLAHKLHRPYARREPAQVENGISDELPGAVISHVAAAVALEDLYARLRELIF